MARAESSGRFVKGTLLVDYVKLIRSNKAKNWKKWLNDEDWEIVNSKILSSSWYPLDTWLRMGSAVFNEVAGGNLAVIRATGPVMMQYLLSVYKNVLVAGDPVSSIEKFKALRENFMKGVESDIVLQKKGAKWVALNIMVTTRDRELGFPEAVFNALTGGVEELVKIAGGKKIQGTISPTPEGFELDLKWE